MNETYSTSHVFRFEYTRYRHGFRHHTVIHSRTSNIKYEYSKCSICNEETPT